MQFVLQQISTVIGLMIVLAPLASSGGEVAGQALVESDANATEILEGRAEKGRTAKGASADAREVPMVMETGDAGTGSGEDDLQPTLIAGDNRPEGEAARHQTGGETTASGRAGEEGGRPSGEADPAKLTEDRIPVLATVKTEKKEAVGGGYHRLILTLVILATLLGAASFAIRRWAGHRALRSQNTKIKVLTQHHLGPKKSLAIIQVAGESLLIGVTDQNISMLKTLSLLDEDIPGSVPGSFEQAITDFDDQDGFDRPESGQSATRGRESRERGEADDFAMRGLSEIRDVVSNRLKNMRNI